MDMYDISRSRGDGLIMRDGQQIVFGGLENATKLVGNSIRVNVVHEAVKVATKSSPSRGWIALSLSSLAPGRSARNSPSKEKKMQSHWMEPPADTRASAA